MRLLSLTCFVLAACTAAPAAPAFEAIDLTAHDGLALAGRSYGSGETVVVLAHMAGPTSNQDDWRPVAEKLAAGGYRVVTYNRPGTCDTDGSACSEVRGGSQRGSEDLVALAQQLRADGARRVILGGASLGAMAALRAAEVAPGVDGVIWMAGGLRGSGYDFSAEDVAQIEAPMLLIASTNDPTTNPGAADLLAEWATAPAEVLLLESDRHGTDVLVAGGAAADQVMAAIERFVGQVTESTR